MAGIMGRAAEDFAHGSLCGGAARPVGRSATRSMLSLSQRDRGEMPGGKHQGLSLGVVSILLGRHRAARCIFPGARGRGLGRGGVAGFERPAAGR